MAQEDPRDTGIPTKAIHEAYLQLQQSHHDYRHARDNGLDTHELEGAFQESILTFYELIRPHLKHETALSDYWSGNIPDYTGWDFNSDREAVAYVRDQGTGVYQVQQHTQMREIKQESLTDGGIQGFEEWHELLGLSWGTERIIAVSPVENSQQYYVKLLRVAVLPLRELDNWRARVTSERAQGSGFMAGKTTTETHREFQPESKLIAAKRLLVEAADKLGALSEFEASTSRTEITREDIEKVEAWHQDQVNQ